MIKHAKDELRSFDNRYLGVVGVGYAERDVIRLILRMHRKAYRVIRKGSDGMSEEQNIHQENLILSSNSKLATRPSNLIGRGLTLVDELSLQQPVARSIVELRWYMGHEGRVSSGAFSSDCQLAILGAESSVLILSSMKDGEEICRFEGHKGYISSVAFSPDSRYILSGGRDGARLWDVEKKSGIDVFKNHEAHEVLPVQVTISPEGYYALTGSYGYIHLWDMKTRQVVGHFAILERLHWIGVLIKSIAFAPGSRFALVGTNLSEIQLLDLQSGMLIHEFEVPKGPVWSLGFSPDGRLALSGSGDVSLSGDWKDNGAVCLWDVESGEKVWGHEDYSEPVWCVAFSSDGRYGLSSTGLYSQNRRNTLRLWRVEDGHEIGKIDVRSEIRSIAFTLDNRHATSISEDGIVQFFSLPV